MNFFFKIDTSALSSNQLLELNASNFINLVLSNIYSKLTIPIDIILLNYKPSNNDDFWFIFLIALLGIFLIFVVMMVCYSIKKKKRGMFSKKNSV